jgi:hypothetical protein
MGLVLILAGISATAAGYARFRTPWAKYQALKAQEANIARYDSWRGGLRDTGTTGASVAIEILRGQARNAGVVIAAGIAMIVLGLLLS